MRILQTLTPKASWYTSEQKKRILKAAVVHLPALASVQDVENRLIVSGQPALDYDKYWELVYSAATSHDRKLSASTRAARRTINYLDMSESEYFELSSPGQTTDSEQPAYAVFAASTASGSPNCITVPMIDREVWGALTPEQQEYFKTWFRDVRDKINRQSQSTRSPRPPRRTQFHEMGTPAESLTFSDPFPASDHRTTQVHFAATHQELGESIHHIQSSSPIPLLRQPLMTPFWTISLTNRVLILVMCAMCLLPVTRPPQLSNLQPRLKHRLRTLLLVRRQSYMHLGHAMC